MKKNVIIISLIFVVPLLVYWMMTMSNSSTARTGEIVGKPQIIKFTSQMCLDCQTMNKIIKEIYPKYEKDIVLTEVQIQDKNSFTDSEIQKYNVTLVPTIILIDSEGQQVKRVEGAISKEEMENCLKGLK